MRKSLGYHSAHRCNTIGLFCRVYDVQVGHVAHGVVYHHSFYPQLLERITEKGLRGIENWCNFAARSLRMTTLTVN